MDLVMENSAPSMSNSKYMLGYRIFPNSTSFQRITYISSSISNLVVSVLLLPLRITPAFRWLGVFVPLIFGIMLFTPKDAWAEAEHIPVIIRIAAEPNLPLAEVDDTGKASGFAIDLMNYIAAKEGWQIQYTSCSWQRCLSMLENGEIDLLALMGYTAERAKKYDFSKQSLITNWGRVFAPVSKHYETVFDLKGRRIAGVKNDIHRLAAEDILQRFDIPVTFVDAENYQEAFRLVAIQAADVAVTHRLFGLKYDEMYGLEPTSIIFNPIEVRTVAPKGKSVAILAAIDSNLIMIKSDPHSIYYELMDKWIGTGFKNKIPQWIFTALIAAIIIGFLLILYSYVLRRKVKESTHEIRLREERYRILFEAESDAIIVVDVETLRLFDANQAAVDLYGFSKPEFPTMQVIDLSCDPASMSSSIRDGSGSLQIPLMLHRKKNGTVFPVEITGRFFTLDNKRALLAAIRDITERRQAEKALLESETRLRSLSECAFDGVMIHDQGLILDCNPQFAYLFGYDSPTELIGRQGPDLLLTRASCVLVRSIIASEKSLLKPLEVTGVRKDGSTFSGETQSCNSIYHGQKVRVVSMRDISERKTAEHALIESEQRFRDLAESLPLTIFETDQQGKITYINKAGLDMYGLTQQNIAAADMNVLQAISPADHLSAKEHFSRQSKGEQIGFREYVGIRRDGTEFPCNIIVSTIVKNSTAIGIRGIISDISERKRAEEQFLKVQKLESIGTLAGGIAHDFNNLLQGVFGYISLARLNVDKQANCLAALEQAEKALHTSVKLTNQLLTFSKGGKPTKKRIDIRPVIENAAKFALAGSRSNYHIVADDDLWQTEADEGQIAQVIQNIILNADQAMPEGGSVEIAARNVPSPGISLPQGMISGKYILVVIKDSGIGIPERFLSKIFDPYFTTKEKGSGLGLATSYAITKNHNGLIDVKSEVGKGTSFSIYLPAMELKRDDGQYKPQQMSAGRIGRLLVMDDDKVIRDVAGQLIGFLGHTVEFAAHGRELLERYKEARQSGKPFDLVILDLTIRGGMGGLETFQRLSEFDPDVKAVVSSGYSEDDAISRFHEYGFKAFLKKPYNINDLQDMLSKLLTP